MYQNYNYYPQTQQQPTAQAMPTYIPNYLRPAQPQGNLKGRLVSSLEEARATSIDFDGSIFYFPDLASKRIYTKQINMDGTATLNMYELKELPVMTSEQQGVVSMNNYITREEFEQAIGQLRNMFTPIEQPTPQTAPIEPTIKQKSTDVVNFF